MAIQTYIITRKQSLLDACIQVYGTSKLLFQFAKDNGLQIDSAVNIGDSLLYDDELGDQDLKNKIEGEGFIINNPEIFIFDPLGLNPVLWLDSRVKVETSDVLGTLFVNAWRDRSDNSRDALQGIGVSRPTYVNKAVIFDGLTSFMSFLNVVNIGKEHTIFIDFNSFNISFANINTFLSELGGTTYQIRAYTVSLFYRIFSTYTLNTAPLAPNTRYILTIRRNQQFLELFVNNVFASSLSISVPNNIDYIFQVMGMRGDGVARFNGAWYNLIVYDKYLNDAEVSQVNIYLNGIV